MSMSSTATVPLDLVGGAVILTGHRRSSPRPGIRQRRGAPPSPALATVGPSPGRALTASGWICRKSCVLLVMESMGGNTSPQPLTWAESCRPWSLTPQVIWPAGCRLSWRSLCPFFSIPCPCPRRDRERDWLWSGLRLAWAPLPSWSQKTGARTSYPSPRTSPPACPQCLLTAH